MGIKTAYKGYKAYSYLEPGKDYPVFELAPWNWVGIVSTGELSGQGKDIHCTT